MKIIDYDPAQGMAFQGDVSIIPLPADIKIDRTDQIKPIDGNLILQEGELTGHHHKIAMPMSRQFRPDVPVGDPILGTNSARLRKAFGGIAKKTTIASAFLFRDPAAAQQMVRRGVLTRADLAVACLLIEGGSMVVSHEEHDGIRLPCGQYLIGRQVESVGAEERRVAD